jgi:hypothetical protein
LSAVTEDMLRTYADSDGLALAALVRKGELTPIELVETAVATIEKLNPQLNALSLRKCQSHLEHPSLRNKALRAPYRKIAQQIFRFARFAIRRLSDQPRNLAFGPDQDVRLRSP